MKSFITIILALILISSIAFADASIDEENCPQDSSGDVSLPPFDSFAPSGSGESTDSSNKGDNEACSTPIEPDQTISDSDKPTEPGTTIENDDACLAIDPESGLCITPGPDAPVEPSEPFNPNIEAPPVTDEKTCLELPLQLYPGAEVLVDGKEVMTTCTPPTPDNPSGDDDAGDSDDSDTPSDGGTGEEEEEPPLVGGFFKPWLIARSNSSATANQPTAPIEPSNPAPQPEPNVQTGEVLEAAEGFPSLAQPPQLPTTPTGLFGLTQNTPLGLALLAVAAVITVFGARRVKAIRN